MYQIEIIHDKTFESDWFGTAGNYETFIVTANGEDYTQVTSDLMQNFATSLFQFPSSAFL